MPGMVKGNLGKFLQLSEAVAQELQRTGILPGSRPGRKASFPKHTLRHQNFILKTLFCRLLILLIST
jgi:hypothetical protein